MPALGDTPADAIEVQVDGREADEPDIDGAAVRGGPLQELDDRAAAERRLEGEVELLVDGPLEQPAAFVPRRGVGLFLRQRRRTVPIGCRNPSGCLVRVVIVGSGLAQRRTAPPMLLFPARLQPASTRMAGTRRAS